MMSYNAHYVHRGTVPDVCFSMVASHPRWQHGSQMLSPSFAIPWLSSQCGAREFVAMHQKNLVLVHEFNMVELSMWS